MSSAEGPMRRDSDRIDGASNRLAGERPSRAERHAVGRAVHSAIGHAAATYDLPECRRFVEAALRWAVGMTE